MSNKTKKPFFHYRNAFKSDHLAKADIEELIENNGRAILTLIKVEYFENRMVAGRNKSKGLVGFFKEKDTKPMIINSSNAETLSIFIGSNDANEWGNINCLVELTINPNWSFSTNKGGIEIKRKQPTYKKKALPKLSNDRLKGLIESIQKGTFTLEKAKAKFDLSNEQLKALENV